MKKARLENVDIFDVLQFVVDNNTSNYATDFEYDKSNLLNSGGDKKHFFWMSRDSGTWLLPERDVFIFGTAAHNTWTSYNEKSDRVKAFMIEVERVGDGRVYGNVTELDYKKHFDYVVSSSEKPTGVQITFRDSMRTFSMEEYKSNTATIRDKYGPTVAERFLPENEHFLNSKVWEARKEFVKDTEIQTVEGFTMSFKERQFAEYNCFDDDREFLNTQEIADFLNYKFGFTAITREGEEVNIQNFDEYQKQSDKDVLFCAHTESRAFVKYLNSNAPPLFNEREMGLIFDCVVHMENEHRVKDCVALNSLMDKLNTLIPDYIHDHYLSENQDFERE